MTVMHSWNPVKIFTQLVAPKNYFGLLLSLSLLALLGAVSSDDIDIRFAATTLAILIVMNIGVAVSQKKHTAYGMFVGGLAVGVMLIMSNIFLVPPLHSKDFQIISYISAIIYVMFANLTILKDVFSGQVNANRICGAICFYLLTGMCFAMFFFVLDLHDHTSFRLDDFYHNTSLQGFPISRRDRFTLYSYYSFTCLSSLGLGDITPISRAARTFTWMEAIFGQLYLSILVARLVGLHIAGSTVTTSTNDEITPDP
jgi:hypothetical protein